MSFSQFLAIMRARKVLVISVALGIFIFGLGLSLILPKKYTGVASVVVDAKPDPLTAIVNPVTAMPAFMATQLDVLLSDRVALRVIRELKLTENDEIRSQWAEDTGGEGSIEQWLLLAVQKNLDVKPSRDSNVINIGYKAQEPRFAAAMANAFAQSYIATTLELRTEPARQFSSFFQSQTKDAREALEKSQSKLSAYQQQKGIIATDERFDVENARLNELSSQLTQLQAITAESASRQGQARGGSGDRMQEVLNNPLVANLKAELSRGEARLKELSARLGDMHPQVIEAKASNAELQGRLNAEIGRVTGGVSVSNSINQQREAQVRQELQAQRQKLLQLKAVRDEGLVLVREVESAQRAYDTMMARVNQTALESQSTQSYVSMLTTALPPIEPSFPRVILNSVVAAILGIFLGVGIAVLREMADRRIRAADDVVLSLGLPVLGVLPKKNVLTQKKRKSLGSRSTLALTGGRRA